MSAPISVTCKKCKTLIKWEQLHGSRIERVYRTPRKGGYRLRAYFATKCGCGDNIKRNSDGRRLRF